MKWSREIQFRWGLLAGISLIFVMGVTVGLGIGIWPPKPESHEGLVRADVVTSPPLPSPTLTLKTITLMAVGDVMLGRSVRDQMIRRDDWTWPWLEVADTLGEADLTIGNLESQVVPGCTQHENRFMFCANLEAIEGLVYAGFDVLSLVNNHDLNYGIKGREDSLRLLEEATISGIMPDSLVTREVEGVRFGFLAFDDVSRMLDMQLVEEQVTRAAENSDVLIGLVHWGSEYVARASERQVRLGRLMVDAGMDVVVGAHPHWVQNVEEYNGKVLFYSLGNFVFDQMWSEETRQGAAVELRFTMHNSRIERLEYDLLPVRIYDYGQPRWAPLR